MTPPVNPRLRELNPSLYEEDLHAPPIVEEKQCEHKKQGNFEYAYDFSAYQEHRHKFIPITPKTLNQCCEKKMKFKEE